MPRTRNRPRGLCQECGRECEIYVAGACKTCYRRHYPAPSTSRGVPIVNPVAKGAPPLQAPTRCQVCGRLAPPSGVCFRCVCVAAYQAPPVPYYPEVRGY